MATVHVLVGQCGNQVGSAFLDALVREAVGSEDEAYQMRVSSTHFRPAFRPYGSPFSKAEAKTQPFFSLQNGTGVSDEGAQLPQPRCVLIDMEPKVIEAAIQRANAPPAFPGVSRRRTASPDGENDERGAASGAPREHYTLARQQCVTRGEGSGNNWAYGYYHQGESRREAIAECLRRESEMKGAVISTFHVLQSIAGGTGSGVGCLVAEEIKLLYPRATLLHSVVWPFDSGEVVTQWYNIMMAMSVLRETADGVFIAYNDLIGDELRGQLLHRGIKDGGEVSYHRMNARISQLLTPLFLPQQLYDVPKALKDVTKYRIPAHGWHADAENQRAMGAPDVSRPQPLRYARSTDVVEALSLDPAMKFFTGTSVPRLVTSSTTWPSVLEEATRVAASNFGVPSAFASCSSLYHRSCLWAIRGPFAKRDGLRELQHLMALSPSAPTSAGPFPLTSLFVSPAEQWSYPEGPTMSERPPCVAPTGRIGVDHEVTLYGASPCIADKLAGAATKAEQLLNVGAFLHHFERYGVTKCELDDAVAMAWDTVAAYQSS